jgi:hypothetical protein
MFSHSVKRETGDGFDKGGIALVYTSQKHLRFKKCEG